MRIIFLTLLFPIVLWGDIEPSSEFNYTLGAELLYMKRSKLQDIPVMQYDGTFGQSDGKVVYLHEVEHELDKEFVPQLTLEIQPNQRHTMEARAQLPARFNSNIEKSVEGKTNVGATIAYGTNLGANENAHLLDFETTNYVAADKGNVHYTTTMYDLELNYWTYATPPRVNYFSVGYGFGLRYMDQVETFRESFTKGSSLSDFRVDTKNHMFGLQAMGKLEVNPYPFLTWGIRAQVEFFGNAMKVINDVRDYDNTVSLKYRSQRDLYYGYLGELDLYIIGHFLSRFHWKLGFQGLWIKGVALAPSNINLTKKPTDIMLNKNIYYTSWTAGLGFSF